MKEDALLVTIAVILLVDRKENMLTIIENKTELYKDSYDDNGQKGYTLPCGTAERSVYLFGIRLFKRKVTYDTDAEVKLESMVDNKKGIGYK